MVKMTLQVEGMMCGMCESHVNDAVRKAFSVKKVTSSHKKGETVILAQTEIPRAELVRVLSETGYNIKDVRVEPYEKKGLFGFGK